MQRRAFVSYAREDAAAVERLAAALRTLQCEVWFDEQIAGGQAWWDVILERVRGCDVFVCVVSQAMLESVACVAELDYAARLRRPLLPVLVQPLSAALLPPSLAVIQLVDFTRAAQDPGLQLGGALLRLASAPPLPTPLPLPPAAPISYLSSLGERLRSPTLMADEQLAIVLRLEEAATKSQQRAAVRQLVTVMLEREDILHRAASRLETLLADCADEPGAPVPPAETGRSGRWSVRLIAGHPKAKTFEISDGWRTWVVQLEVSFFLTMRSYIDGERTQVMVKGGTYTIALPGSRTGTEELVILGNSYTTLDGLTLSVDNDVLYRDGSSPSA